MPANPSNATSPVAIVAVDPQTGAVVGAGVVGYTAINTVGTTTVKASAGVFFGITVTNTGTTFGVAVYDITTSGTNTLLPPSAYGLGFTGLGGVGVRNSQLVVVTTGTAGGVNVLWD